MASLQGQITVLLSVKDRGRIKPGTDKKGVEAPSEASSTLHLSAAATHHSIIIWERWCDGVIQFLHWHRLVQRSRSAQLLSLHISFFPSPQPSATHLGLVTHDS